MFNKLFIFICLFLFGCSPIRETLSAKINNSNKIILASGISGTAIATGLGSTFLVENNFAYSKAKLESEFLQNRTIIDHPICNSNFDPRCQELRHLINVTNLFKDYATISFITAGVFGVSTIGYLATVPINNDLNFKSNKILNAGILTTSIFLAAGIGTAIGAISMHANEKITEQCTFANAHCRSIFDQQENVRFYLANASVYSFIGSGLSGAVTGIYYLNTKNKMIVSPQIGGFLLGGEF